MPLVRIALVALCTLAAAAPARAQNAAPYVLGEVGGSFGDGGAAPAVAVGFGYLTARKIGFEIELSYVPDLDLGDPGIPRIAVFPPITVQSSGRLLSFQTNAVGVLQGSGTKFRAFVLAGGGVADLKQKISVRFPDFDLRFFDNLVGLGLVPPPITFRDVTRETSDANLLLGVGAGIEYEITRRLAVGTSVRYQHVFSEPRSLDLARASIRASWRF